MQVILILIIISLAIGMICLIDLWNKKCSIMRRVLWSPIPFIPLLGPMLYYALFEPPSVQPDKASVPKNAIERWKEWINNQYNPGYFTGGQIAPIYRVKGKSVGILFLFFGIIDLALAFVMGLSEDRLSRVMLLFNLVIAFVMIYAGLMRIVEGKKKKTNKEKL
jgi:hypothetical protein